MYKDNKRFVVETKFINNIIANELNLNEFLLVMYFDNEIDPIFNIDLLKKYIKLNEEDLMFAFANLVEKKLIKVNVEKDSKGKMIEKISLDGFYNLIKKELKKEEKNDTTESIYSKFESEFGRTLSGMDYEIIKAWINKGFSEELIESALKEASYNGVKSLRYIDKILFEWEKKGIKKKEEINTKKESDESLCETKLLNFNWLDND